MMYVAASTRSFWDLSFADACEKIQSLGFDKVEIWMSEQFDQVKPSTVVSDPDSVVASLHDSSRLSPVAITLDHEVDLSTFRDVVAFAKQLKIAQVTIPASPLGTPFNTEVDRLRERNKIAHFDGVRLSILTQTEHLTQDPHTAVELCQSVPGIGLTLDPSYYVCTSQGIVDFSVVYPNVSHVRLRDSTPQQLQVPCGLGEVDYNQIIASLESQSYERALSVELLPHTLDGEERDLELRKLRLLLESLL